MRDEIIHFSSDRIDCVILIVDEFILILYKINVTQEINANLNVIIILFFHVYIYIIPSFTLSSSSLSSSFILHK